MSSESDFLIEFPADRDCFPFVQDFIEDLIEIGADVIHPLQGGINRQEDLQSKYGDRVVFFNCLGNIVHLPDTSEPAIRDEMRRVMRLYWNKKNLIMQANSCVPGNPEILLDEARKYNKEHM